MLIFCLSHAVLGLNVSVCTYANHLTTRPRSRSVSVRCFKANMIGFIFKKLIGSKNDREVKKLRPLVVRINEIETGLQSLSEDDLRKKTADWKAELSAIQDNDELASRLQEIMPEAFAVVKNGCRRLCGRDITVRGHPLKWEMVPFDVQLIGGMGLH